MKTTPFFELINYIGYYGPIILFIISLILLFNTKTFLYIYFIGFVISSIFNFIIKGIIKQKRPFKDFKTKIIKESRLGNEIYGMPSGHSQSVMFSTLFLLLALKNDLITFIYLIISGTTMWQRVYNYSHSPLQILIGGTIGSLFGYYAYKYSKKVTKKMEKKEKKKEKKKMKKKMKKIMQKKEKSYEESYQESDYGSDDLFHDRSDEEKFLFTL
jgi:membrane-associated phospholipid phosphatase